MFIALANQFFEWNMMSNNDNFLIFICLNFISQPIQVAAGQAGSYTCEYTVTRNLQNNPWWTINGTIYSGYHTNAIDFALGVRAVDNDSVPALYKNGAGTSSVWNTLKSGSWFEICEPIANQ